MSLARKMQRRNAQAFAKYARSLPEVDFNEALRPGVTHMIMSHDHDCKAARTHSSFDCTCSPDISYHRDSLK